MVLTRRLALAEGMNNVLLMKAREAYVNVSICVTENQCCGALKYGRLVTAASGA